MARLTGAQAGEAGEYAVAAELANRGWTVDLARRGRSDVDLYARPPARDRTCGIQVKAQQRVGDFTVTGLASPAAREGDEWAILVTLPEPGARATFYVVPRNHAYAVIAAIEGSFARQGKAFAFKAVGSGAWEGYEEGWELMDSPAIEAPWLMPDWVNWTLDEQGRDDLFELIPKLPRPR